MDLKPDSVFIVKNDGNEYYVSYLFSDISDVPLFTNSIQFKPTNYSVTHHASMLVDTLGQFRDLKVPGNILNVEKNEFHLIPPGNSAALQSLHSLLGLYIPGVEKTELTSAAFHRFPARADLLVQVHYVNHQSKPDVPASFTPSFFDSPPEGAPVQTMLIGIDKLVNGPFLLKADSKHSRGSKFLAYALDPQHDTIPIIRINN